MAKYFPELAACFLGALLETGFYVICTGFATKFGGSYPSFNHVEGKSMDITYFWTLQNDINFLQALYQFGFRYLKIGHNDYYYPRSLYNGLNAQTQGVTSQDTGYYIKNGKKIAKTTHKTHVHAQLIK